MLSDPRVRGRNIRRGQEELATHHYAISVIRLSLPHTGDSMYPCNVTIGLVDVANDHSSHHARWRQAGAI